MVPTICVAETLQSRPSRNRRIPLRLIDLGFSKNRPTRRGGYSRSLVVNATCREAEDFSESSPVAPRQDDHPLATAPHRRHIMFIAIYTHRTNIVDYLIRICKSVVRENRTIAQIRDKSSARHPSGGMKSHLVKATNCGSLLCTFYALFSHPGGFVGFWEIVVRFEFPISQTLKT